MTYDTKQQTRPYASEAVREIALDALNTSDCILIKTANSTYCFVVTNPVKRRGILMGGALARGQQPPSCSAQRSEMTGKCLLYFQSYTKARRQSFLLHRPIASIS